MDVHTFEFWKAPREFDGEDVLILGGGPSLKDVPVEQLYDHRVIAVNNAYLLAPWADILYWGDRKWWNWNHRDLWRHTGRYKVTRRTITQNDYDVKVMRYMPDGWSRQQDGLGGRDSGFSALNLAALMGAARAFLFGFDMHRVEDRNNWHDLHKTETKDNRYTGCFLPRWETNAPLIKEDIEVINCTPGSALGCFPIVTVADGLTMAFG